MSVEHYENFPVASMLCPPVLRPSVTALYRFARTADDLADEGEAAPAERLAALAEFRADLFAAARHGSPSARWPEVFAPLRQSIEQHRLPLAPLTDLLDAFEQDVRRQRYADRADLLDYCRRSAEPVGRLLLHLYGIGSPAALRRSDAICTALQLVNFWQDLGLDASRGRLYPPADDCARHGVDPADLLARRDSPAVRALVAELVGWARATMHEGAPLVHQVPGRAGWELRGVVQGGLLILDKIAAGGFDSLRHRPRLRPHDLPRMAWRALWMRAPTGSGARPGERRNAA